MGKFFSYLFVGYIIFGILLITTKILFHIPWIGNIFTLLIATFPFIITNLTIGVTASTIARNQAEAQQLCAIIYLPSILLSGVMFPFYSMPYWGRVIGSLFPLTHFNRIISGIMIKGYDWSDILPEMWPIIIFFLVTLSIGVISLRSKIA